MQRGAKRRRVVTLQPCRNIRQQGKAGGVRFGKTIFAETANLLEQSLGKFFRQPAGPHPFDQLDAEIVDHARPPPGGHRAPQLVGLARREAGRHDGQPHRLLLKQRHAQRFFEHGPNRVVGIRDLLRSPAAAADKDAPCRLESARAARSPLRSPGRKTARAASRGSMLIWARLSIWNTPIVSARQIIS